MADWLSEVGKVSAIFRAEKKLQGAQETMNAYMAEVQDLCDPDQRQMYKERMSLLSYELASCTVSLREAHESLSLQCGRRSNTAEDDNTDDSSKRQMYRRASKSLRKIIGMSSAVTCEELMHQKQEIEAIDKEVAPVEEKRNRSSCFIKKVRSGTFHRSSRRKTAHSWTRRKE
jgi:hypothetical protein